MISISIHIVVKGGAGARRVHSALLALAVHSDVLLITPMVPQNPSYCPSMMQCNVSLLSLSNSDDSGSDDTDLASRHGVVLNGANLASGLRIILAGQTSEWTIEAPLISCQEGGCAKNLNILTNINISHYITFYRNCGWFMSIVSVLK